MFLAGTLDAQEEKGESSSDLFSQAEFYFHAGKLTEAKQIYQDFWGRVIQDPRMDRVMYRLGQIDQRYHSPVTARRFYRLLLEKFPDTLLANEVMLNMAQCFLKLENFKEAESLLNQLVRMSPDKNLRVEAMFYLAQVDEKRFDYDDAIGKLKNSYIQSENKKVRDHAARLIRTIVDKKLSKEMTISLIRKYKTGFPADLLLLNLISRYRLERDIVNYRSALNEFLNLFPSHRERPQIEKYLAQTKEDNNRRSRLGVILPLTGKRALTGQRVLQGIQLAINKAGRSVKEKLDLVVKDSAASRTIVEVIEEFASDPLVIGVLGPVLSDEVKEVVPVVEKYKLPILTPTASSPGLPELSSFIFRNALTREMQGRFIARYAVNKLNLKRFAVLYPMLEFGRELKESFVNEIKSLGGDVVAEVFYDRSQTDFKQEILDIGGITDDDLKKMINDQVMNNVDSGKFGPNGVLSKPHIEMGLLTEDKIENLKVSLELSYGAIFLPGFYDKVGLIIPQLAFYNIEKVILLGGSGWNSPELINIAGKFLKQGYFVDGFFSESNHPQVRQFVKKFTSTFGEEPTILSAQSYDSAQIFIQMVLSGINNRLSARGRLQSLKNFPGTSGSTTILPSGDSEKELFALKIKRKKIVEEN